MPPVNPSSSLGTVQLIFAPLGLTLEQGVAAAGCAQCVIQRANAGQLISPKVIARMRAWLVGMGEDPAILRGLVIAREPVAPTATGPVAAVGDGPAPRVWSGPHA